MKNREYIVNRDDIFVGDVCGINPEKIRIYSDGLFDFSSIDFGLTSEEEVKKSFAGRLYLFKRDTEQLDYGYAGGWVSTLFQRTMLFILDESLHANDLLYDSPHYPILNISPNEDCLNSSICILHNTYQIGEVLKYFGYPEELNYDDIVKIRRTLFNCDFVLDNCQLFGRFETDPHETSYETFDSKGNHRTFNLIKKNSFLSYKYFDCFVCNRDHFVFTDHKDMVIVEDAFLPNEKEGKIKSLCR